MRLLIVTQKVDKGDPVLGFFHRWIEEFARHCESLTVIALSVGDVQLPKNVTVLSLGKEVGTGKIVQVVRFFRFISTRHASYDAVFVHMTSIWTILGFPVWKILGKRSYLWHEGYKRTMKLRLALLCVRKVFSATSKGLPFPSPKHIVVGHGIDTAFFSSSEDQERAPGFLCTVGRMTRIKHIEIILRSVAELLALKRLLIIGGAVTAEDRKYQEEMVTLEHTLDIAEKVQQRTLRQEEVVVELRRASLFVHASGGGLDKALLEAMACECPVVSICEAAASVLPTPCIATKQTFTRRMEEMLGKADAERRQMGRELRRIVTESHSLSRLIERLVSEMDSGN